MAGVKIQPIILCGGAGTRLWPLSRHMFPKQLHALTGERSLLQETALRVSDADRFTAPIIVCNEVHRFAVGAQLAEVGITPARIILEPQPKNTAPALVAAALISVEQEGPLFAVPSDHFISGDAEFFDAVDRAAGAARDGRIATFGIPPSKPETGYGYLVAGEKLGDGTFALAGFIEKPREPRARALINEGAFWNSGMFLYNRDVLLEEIGRFEPSMIEHVKGSIERGRRDQDFLWLEPAAFGELRGNSIDYAVMERTQRGAIVPAAFRWSDIGSWEALWSIGEKSEQGNVAHGDVRLIDSKNCYVRGEDALIAAIGVEDLVIVESGDAVLVARRDRVQDLKQLVADLKRDRRREHHNHRHVHRPWGHFVTLTEGPGHQVKVLTLKPGAAISLQIHRQRAEHWVVLEGEAEVTLNGRIVNLRAHEAIDVPIGATHRLRNAGSSVLRVVEVQSGPYLGEDDIERVEP
ncbi:MAG: mannose-1-phosphate guanylyltransferase/mannose-6-phosphate isomerase [Alphaproteobacteria bacterium]|nr:mannose-1-phosphate guanylyltransferase/mannose-6-phosphate isomerase [Alphaproteobacteria bacterium]